LNEATLVKHALCTFSQVQALPFLNVFLTLQVDLQWKKQVIYHKSVPGLGKHKVRSGDMSAMQYQPSQVKSQVTVIEFIIPQLVAEHESTAG